MYDMILHRAEKSKNTDTLNALKEIGRPPYKNTYDLLVLNDLLKKYGYPYDGTITSIITGYFLKGTEYSPCAIPQIARGLRFSQESLLLRDEVWKLNLFTQVPEMKVPVIFMMGRNDYITNASIAERYFNA